MFISLKQNDVNSTSEAHLGVFFFWNSSNGFYMYLNITYKVCIEFQVLSSIFATYIVMARFKDITRRSNFLELVWDHSFSTYAKCSKKLTFLEMLSGGEKL